LIGRIKILPIISLFVKKARNKFEIYDKNSWCWIIGLVAEINLARNVDEVKNFELRNDCSAKLEETAGLKKLVPKKHNS